MPEEPPAVLSDDQQAALIKATAGKDFDERRDRAYYRRVMRNPRGPFRGPATTTDRAERHTEQQIDGDPTVAGAQQGRHPAGQALLRLLARRHARDHDPRPPAVLLPNNTGNYYAFMELVTPDQLDGLQAATVVISPATTLHPREVPRARSGAPMSTWILVLRLLHVVAGAFWVGAVVMTVFFVEPAAKSLGREGERFLAQVAVRQRLVAVLVVAAVTTAVAGALLYWVDSDGLRTEWISTRSGLGFTLGAVAGMVAFAIPGLAFRPAIARLAALLNDRGTARDAGTDDGAPHAIDDHFRRWSVIQAVLLLVAIAAMATARYLP